MEGVRTSIELPGCGWERCNDRCIGASAYPAPRLFNIESWIPKVERIGLQDFPRVDPVSLLELPSDLIAFDRRRQSEVRESTYLHFYVDDRKLGRLVDNPRKYVEHFASYGGLIGPDFSLYRDMPRFMRELHTYINRALTAFFCPWP